jgi:ferredoxin-NADP reductase
MLQTFKTQLTGKEKLAPEIFLLKFKLIESSVLNFMSGQYMMLLCPQESGVPLRRLYSIASSASIKDSFEIIVEIVEGGVASEYFLRMREGDEVLFQGPAGLFTLHAHPKRILLATGTGIAPMRSMICDLVHSQALQTEETHLLWGVPYIHDVYMIDELIETTKKSAHFRFSIGVSRETNLDSVDSQYKKYFTLGRITKKLEETFPTLPTDYDYYLCGGRTVVESLRLYLHEKNIPKERIIFEKF